MVKVLNEHAFQREQSFTYPPLIDKDGTRRRCGSTTRRIDFFIQELFAIGETTITDHHSSSGMNDFIWRRVLDRLEREHPRDEFVACRIKHRIKLLNPKSFDNIQEQRPDMLNRKNPIHI